MLTCAFSSVNATLASSFTVDYKQGGPVADIQIEDGILRIRQLDIQDPSAAAILSAYPQTRWAEITRRAVKIGLGYLKGGERA